MTTEAQGQIERLADGYVTAHLHKYIPDHKGLALQAQIEKYCEYLQSLTETNQTKTIRAFNSVLRDELSPSLTVGNLDNNAVLRLTAAIEKKYPDTQDKYAAFLSDVEAEMGKDYPFKTLKSEDVSFPQIHEAFLYLAKTFLTHNNDQPRPLSNGDLDKKMAELFNGLDRYFRFSSHYQNELISLNVQAARDTMLTEAFFIALDEGNNPRSLPIRTKKALHERLIEVIDAMGYDTVIIPEKIDLEPLLTAVQANREAKTPEEKMAAAQQLRKEIKTFMQVVELPEITATQKQKDQFVQARRLQTSQFNQYQAQLRHMLEQTESALEEMEHDAADYQVLKFGILPALQQRLSEVEGFRNGYQRKLHPQLKILEEFKLSQPYSGIHPLEDIPEPFCNMDDVKYVHPLIDKLRPLQAGLKRLAERSKGTYFYHPPTVELLDSGVKSWKRTVEKLVYEYDADWSRMRDLSRINGVFGRAETLYHFNEALRERAQAKGWYINPPDTLGSSHNDRHTRLMPTGDQLWIMNFDTGLAEDGLPWSVEIKLDGAKQREIETYHHPIYECTRLVETDKRVIDVKRLATPVTGLELFEKFVTRCHSALTSLADHNPFPDTEIDQRLQDVMGLSGKLREGLQQRQPFSVDEIKSKTIELHDKMTELHIAMCCEAATHSSRNMAALYKINVDRKLAEMKQKERLLEPGEECDLLRKRIKMLSDVYAKHGPKEITKENKLKRGYEKHHLRAAEKLISDFEAGWEADRQQKALRTELQEIYVPLAENRNKQDITRAFVEVANQSPEAILRRTGISPILKAVAEPIYQLFAKYPYSNIALALQQFISMLPNSKEIKKDMESGFAARVASGSGSSLHLH